MKISELQEVLEKFKQENGDLEIVEDSFTDSGRCIHRLEADDFYLITDYDGKTKLLNIFS